MVREAPALAPLKETGDPTRPAVPQEPVLDIADIQGNILAGFNKDFQTLLFLRITDAVSAREWLKALVPFVATTSEVLAFNRLFKEIRRRRKADTNAVQATWVNVALSFKGLQAIAGEAAALQTRAAQFRNFSSANAAGVDVNAFKDEAFREGLAARSDRLNDPASGEGSKAEWVFGGPNNEADIVLIVASDGRDNLDDEVARLENTIYSDRTLDGHARSGVQVIYKQQGATLPPPLTGHEHFGFLDGVSQPGIRGLTSPNPNDVFTLRQNPNDPDQGKPGQDLLWPGEFIFGYPGQPKSPTADPADPGVDPMGDPADPNAPAWARNGSFFVVRRLRQDVPAFHKFLKDSAATIGIPAEHLGAKLVGRWDSGAPIMRAPNADNPPLSLDDCANNNFEFRDATAPIPPSGQPDSALCSDNTHPQSPGDLTGDICPFAAHIRKTYPRDDEGDLAPGQINETTTHTHRLLRRGIPYGEPFFEPKDPDRQRDAGDRGLVFAAYQTSIPGQFEFVQSAWANNPEFKDKSQGGNLVSGFDMIIGQAGGDRKRACPVKVNGTSHLVQSDKDWVIPTGGGYFFAPSIDALCLLTGADPVRGREVEAQAQARKKK